MAALAETTTQNHEEIKAWVNSRNGKPAKLAADSTGKPGSPLTIWFPEAERDVKQSFMALEWKEFFEIFDKEGHTFKYGTEEGDTDYCAIE